MSIIIVEKELLKSNAFRGLSGTAKTVYLDFLMKRKIKGVKAKQGRQSGHIILNNGELVYTYAEAEHKAPSISRKAFMTALDSLISRGLIDVHHSGAGGKKGDKSLYGISERWHDFGTDKFISASRPKDKRQGRGWAVYWKNKKQS